MARDESHFDRLAHLLDLERQAERERRALDKAQLPLAELAARGLVLLDVEAQEFSVGLGGRHLVTFTHERRGPLPARFSPGDLVTVAPRKAEVEDAPGGTVSRSTRTSLEIAFDRPPPEWMSEGRLRIDLVANDVTWERAKAALATWKGYEQGQKRDRREVVLGNQPPRFDKPPAFEPSRPLNPEQTEAVALALCARDVALVHGPPGTGKSTVLAELAVQWARRGKRLLCTAASNAAVDRLLELCLDAGLDALRIGHPARVLPRLQEHTLDLQVEAHADRQLARGLFEDAFDLLGYARKQRSRGRSRERFSNAREAQAEARKLMDEARALERKAVAAVLGHAQVVCATCAMLDSSILRGQSFDVALLDEATQAVEPLALMAFLKAPTVVLAGDPQQLAPTVISLEAQAQGLGTSLFERLLADSGDEVKRMLKEQYRMHEGIMTFPSQRMYQGQLRAHPSVAGHTLEDVLSAGAKVDAPPVLFLDTAGKGFEEVKAPGTESLRNEGEAELIVARARELLAAGLSPQELAVITPYRAQASLIRERLIDVAELEVDTVDAFQGREKDAVLVSLVRSNAEQQVGFLEDLRRMNVAITRPRRHLFVVGDSATLCAHEFYAAFQDAVQAAGGYRSAWEWPSQ
ncbi:MAG: AAA family ATPase [Myxococcales bacterium]|nr:AAA family ATPase [Myxococcales bacterium]